MLVAVTRLSANGQRVNPGALLTITPGGRERKWLDLALRLGIAGVHDSRNEEYLDK